MWKKLADKYRNDALYRAAIDVLADRYDDGMASAIKATALAPKREDTFWGWRAENYRNDAGFRVTIDLQSAQGRKVAYSVQATAFAA